jgi:hypothetical protein
MDIALAIAPFFFMTILPATTAMTMILVLAFLSFTRSRWASRRSLAAYVIFGLVGYLVSLAYYAIVGIPSGASSIFNLALLGAFFASGYGGTAALIYFERHRNNPLRAQVMAKDVA